MNRTPFHTFRVRLWARVGITRVCMMELIIKAINGPDAATIAALDAGLADEDWNDGTANPNVVIRVEDWSRLTEVERRKSA